MPEVEILKGQGVQRCRGLKVSSANHRDAHPQAWALAWGWPPCWVHWPQAPRIPWWTGQLLLPPCPLLSARFYITEATAPGVYRIAWAFVRFLSEIPLWAELYWAVLGCCKTSLPCCQLWKDPLQDGKENAGLSWWCPPGTNSKVCCQLLFLFWDSVNHFANLQIGQLTLFLHIVKVCPVPKQHGPTKNTMGIAFFPQIWLHLWRKWYQSSYIHVYTSSLHQENVKPLDIAWCPLKPLKSPWNPLFPDHLWK